MITIAIYNYIIAFISRIYAIVRTGTPPKTKQLLSNHRTFAELLFVPVFTMAFAMSLGHAKHFVQPHIAEPCYSTFPGRVSHIRHRLPDRENSERETNKFGLEISIDKFLVSIYVVS
jgi:hypothetical protein